MTRYHVFTTVVVECPSGEYIPLDKLSICKTLDLLSEQPQHFDKVDTSKWQGGDWVYLLTFHPQFFDKVDFSKFISHDYYILLLRQPSFVEKIDLSKIDSSDWGFLLDEHADWVKYRERELE